MEAKGILTESLCGVRPEFPPEEKAPKDTIAGNVRVNLLPDVTQKPKHISAGRRRCIAWSAPFRKISKKIDMEIEKIEATYREDEVDLHINRLFRLLHRAKLVTITAAHINAIENTMAAFFRKAKSNSIGKAYRETIEHIQMAYERGKQGITPCIPIPHPPSQLAARI